MANINAELLAAIRKKTGLSVAAVYARIQQAATSEFLPRNLAAIKVAADEGVAINRYAKPEELAQLRPDLLTKLAAPYERNLTGQARPNVLFECGMAFSSHPDRTVMIQIGQVRPFSDTYGRHIVNMTSGDPSKRQEFAIKLQN